MSVVPALAGTCEKQDITCVVANDDAFDGIGSGGGAGKPGGTGSSGGAAPVGAPRPKPTTQVLTTYAPICLGNTANDGDVLCGAAVEVCPTVGDVAFWVWTQTVPVGQPADPGRWRKDLSPPYLCLGANDPALSPTQAIPGIVQRDFASYAITRGTLVVDPEGRTLVGFPTRFWTDAVEYTFSETILGRRVDITAKPVRYTFHFGDGTSETRTTAPRANTDDLVHSYDKEGARAAYVVVEWSGTYVIAGSTTVLDVRGTATTTGAPTAVAVREARSQYETG